jgi:L-aspartate semialdehyde sulfurtransferase
MQRTIAEINAKIREGKAVVVTAEEMTRIGREKGSAAAAREVDVVTTGTFGMMCSSGAFLNFGHARPRIRMQHVLLNGVPAYGGLAAVDAYLGATELRSDDPGNQPFPGEFRYGGGHVIEELVAGKRVRLEATSYGTDCYPSKQIASWVALKDLNQAYIFNPRNCYQNYNVAANTSRQVKYTYMGILKPRLGNVSYSGAGELSPLMNDPFLRTIGIGTRVLLGGGVGYVAWEGTQHDPTVARNERGIPTGGAATLALIGDMRGMRREFVRGVSMLGYGVSLAIGVAVPIPILDEDMAFRTSVADADIVSPIVDYAESYPARKPGVLGHANFADLKRGRIVLDGREVPASPMSSLVLARRIAEVLKTRIVDGDFTLTEPVAPLPGPDDGRPFQPLEVREQ